MQTRHLSLDIARGLAALSVVFTHWVRLPDAHAAPNVFDATAAAVFQILQRVAWADGGIHPGVVVFIVLSGFCIHLPVARQPLLLDRDGFWQTYVRRRFWRIAPVYWCGVGLGLALLAAAALRSEFMTAITLTCGDCPPSPVGPMLPFAVAARAAFLSTWLPVPELELGNRPLFTVVSEVWLYAAYPLVLAVRLRLGWGTALAAALGLHLFALITLVSWGVDGLLAQNSALSFLVFWVLGAAAAEWTAASRQARRWWEAIPVVASATFVVSQYALVFPGAAIVHTLLLALAFALSIGIWVRLEMVRPRLTQLRRALAWLGERSYSLYVVHFPVLGLTAGLGIAVGLDLYWVAPIAIAAATLIVYRFIERPSHEFGRRGPSRIAAQPVLEYAPVAARPDPS